jgi:hypothetical protein
MTDVYFCSDSCCLCVQTSRSAIIEEFSVFFVYRKLYFGFMFRSLLFDSVTFYMNVRKAEREREREGGGERERELDFSGVNSARGRCVLRTCC